MERLSPLDAFFLFIEDGTTHMHIAYVRDLRGPGARVRERVLRRSPTSSPLVPRYRQVVRFVPLQLGPPVWVDDPHFRLGVPPPSHGPPAHPAVTQSSRDLMGRLMSQELDRHRPLWEAWMVEGLEHGRWALIMKIHHCMADGVSGNDLFTVILDRERRDTDDACGRVAARARAVGPPPRRRRDVAPPSDPVRGARRGAPCDRRAGSGARPGCATSPRDALSYARRIPPTEPNSLVGSIGPHRRWTWASASARRREDDPARLRRDGQRRHRRRRHRRPTRAPPESGGAHRRARRPYADPGLGAPGGRTRHLRQPRVGDVRRSAGRHRRRGRTARRGARADGDAQGLAPDARPGKG